MLSESFSLVSSLGSWLERLCRAMRGPLVIKEDTGDTFLLMGERLEF